MAIVTTKTEISVNGRTASTSLMTIEGRSIETDPSGQGHAWRAADEDTCPANIRQEIACEIIDGKVSETSDYVASNGQHYRWS